MTDAHRSRIALLLLAPLALALYADERPAWRARRRPDMTFNREANALVLASDWPSEPASPASVDVARLAGALREICGTSIMRVDRATRYAEWITARAREFEIDPFLLAALVHRGSGCRPDAAVLGGIGLTSVPLRTYADTIRAGVLRYSVRREGRWEERSRPLAAFAFNDARLARAESNLYFAAALLAMWRDQHETVDAAFEQVTHRHYVAHFIWGDRVLGRGEDAILTDRRRVLEYYGAIRHKPFVDRGGIRLSCPLDGAPRVVFSGLGSPRDGARAHHGLDIESDYGEPVRAIADGHVVFAGVDLPGGAQSAQLARSAITSVPRAALGPGGRYVCIVHPSAAGEPLRSCYMHLLEVLVSTGQQIRRGDHIGSVGRTGVHDSPAHLHFELSRAGVRLGPEEMGGLLLGRP